MTSSGEFPGEFQAGDIVGDTYLVVDYLGRGAMGHVYHVRHEMLNTEYALKTLSSDKVTELAWRRFQNEAQAIAILNHPNIVGIYNLGLHRGILPFYVMDYLRGLDLGQKIQADGPVEVKQAAQIFIEVCAGIAYAHKNGIIHRDIKPGNIFLLAKPSAGGATVKVVDFGIAKLSETKDPKNQELTSMGDVVGTPYYMSPEQCMGQRVDARSDVYSLGCTLFEALTGTLPFRGRNPTETMLLHQSSPPLSLNKASGGKDFPDMLEYIVATTLAKEPAERYQTMDQLAKDLATLVEGKKPIVSATDSARVELTEVAPALPMAGVKHATQRQLAPIVLSVVTVLFAFGGFVYWQSIHKTDKSKQMAMAEQLKSISGPNALDPIAVKKDALKIQQLFFDDRTPSAAEIKLPPHQMATASLFVDKPFSIIGKEDGKNRRIFNFPTDVVIGQISTDNPPQYLKAIGELSFPQYQTITFIPSEIVARFPKCLKRWACPVSSWN